MKSRYWTDQNCLDNNKAGARPSSVLTDYLNTYCMVTDKASPGLWWLISAADMSVWQPAANKQTNWTRVSARLHSSYRKCARNHLSAPVFCRNAGGQDRLDTNQAVANSWGKLYAWSYHSSFELPFHHLFHQNTELIISVKSQNQNDIILIVDNFL